MSMQPSVQTSEVGGGPAVGLSEDLVGALENFVSGAPARTGSIMDRINQIIAGEDISGQERALESIFQSDVGRGSADIRERFGAGGIGTPAAVAESLFRAEAAPRGTLAIGQLRQQRRAQQLQAMLPIFQLLGMIGGRGISQREAQTIVGDSPFSQVTSGIAGIAQGGGSVAAAL